ncbi:hypothetical protein [Ulvibacter sp. MAR_2010_11]|uniref:hypothetical protein n=1 Tax=Ulvibacter sp. MAR_2010_11 TaxID=1250229 RepID=UPI000C2CBE84|nr:hypothetical protein [Ulvibacter sp. MAR_2010_11]
MKTYCLQSILLFACILATNCSLFAQVGIGTTNARKTLEVAGDMQISGDLNISKLNPLSDTDISTFMVQDSDQSLKSIDVSNPTGAALGYIQEYTITNPNLDWVLDFDTQVDSSEFVLITISASYDTELVLSNSANADENASLPYTATFISGGTWHIIADFPMAANRNTAEIGTWTITTLIFSKDLSKQLGTLNIPMLNASTGSASTPIID